MPKLFNISDWNAQPWYSTGGTRAKKYLQRPDGTNYYFKRSLQKPGKDYKFEFWSEIVASEVGQLLGFDVLRYDIATDNEIMGCICQAMINPDKEELIEGIRYLQAYDPTFNPENTKQRYLYTFQLIEEALEQFGLDNFIDKIIEIIVFDSIIGNSDRHQENWAFISDYTVITKGLKLIEKDVKEKGFDKLPGLFRRIFKRLIEVDKNRFNKEGTAAILHFHKPKSAAPIYDNGSSLGRELLDGRITHLLENQSELLAYVSKGTSEIHWNGKKLDHFSLIKQLLNSPHAQIADKVIKRVVSLFDGTKIAEIVYEIDNLVPEFLAHYRLPGNRKELIIKMIILRIEKLKEFVNEGI